MEHEKTYLFDPHIRREIGIVGRTRNIAGAQRETQTQLGAETDTTDSQTTSTLSPIQQHTITAAPPWRTDPWHFGTEGEGEGADMQFESVCI